MGSAINNGLALRVEGLSKCFHIYSSPRQRLLQAIWGKRKRYYREFWALDQVSFELPRGETLGVVGRNGSGKSTLLQLVCGTLTASTGSISRVGRVGALLELGSGFNPEFTGLENVYLNAALLGLSTAAIEQQLDAILAFADIGEFIHQPIKSYSSGMVVRLAFAVQAHINPDILVVDEALAVGDELFQRKCYRRLEELKERGCSTLLVTHNCQLINQHCDRALLLHQGRLRLSGAPQRVTAMYQQLAGADDEEWDQILEGSTSTRPLLGKPPTALSYQAHGAAITSVALERWDGLATDQISFDEGFRIRFSYQAEQNLEGIQCGCHIADPSGRRYTGQVHPSNPQGLKTVAAGDSWEIIFSFRSGLLPGVYFVGGGIWGCEYSQTYIHRVVDWLAFRIVASDGVPRVGTCDLTAEAPVMVMHRQSQASDADHVDRHNKN